MQRLEQHASFAARHGIIVVAPDTSPRGQSVANDPAYDLGQSAGVYLNATQRPWAPHYRMQDYVAAAVELVAQAAERLPLLVDQGEVDEFLDTQLRPGLLRDACSSAGHPRTLRLHAGHDHSYCFIAAFLGDHFAHHAAELAA